MDHGMETATPSEVALLLVARIEEAEANMETARARRAKAKARA